MAAARPSGSAPGHSSHRSEAAAVKPAAAMPGCRWLASTLRQRLGGPTMMELANVTYLDINRVKKLMKVGEAV